MGLFDVIFGNRPKPKGKYEGSYKLLNGYEPSFHPFKGSLYESELIRAAINVRATHISKLKFEIMGSARPALQVKLKHGPNQFQTWSQFLYRLSTILDIHNTALICPIYDEYGEPSGIFTPIPSHCVIVQYDDVPYLRYEFSNGQRAAIELAYCGIMTKYQYRHDFFGESNEALMPTIDLIHILNQGIDEGVKSAASYKFIAQVSNFSKASDLAAERKRFSEENFGKEVEAGGLLLFPNTYKDIRQIDIKPWIVDDKQMELINKSVFEYFGVNEDILTSKAYGDAWQAFYESVVESFAIQCSEVLDKMFFTLRERSNGNKVMLTANRLQYMSTSEKLNVSSQMADRGIMNRDEIREIWNLPPLPNGEGQAYIIRGEYKNADEATEGANNE